MSRRTHSEWGGAPACGGILPQSRRNLRFRSRNLPVRAVLPAFSPAKSPQPPVLIPQAHRQTAGRSTYPPRGRGPPARLPARAPGQPRMMIGGNPADPFCGQLGQHRRVNWPACPPGRLGNPAIVAAGVATGVARALQTGFCLQRLPARATGQQSGQAGNTRQGTCERRLTRSVARPPARVFRGKRALDLAA